MKFTYKRNISDIVKNVQGLKNARLQVGWFEDSKYDDGTKIGEVAEWQEYGGEEYNVAYPPRPFMRSAQENNQETWSKIMDKKIAEIVDKGGEISEAMKVLGNVVKGDIQEAIIAVTTPPLAQSTIKARQKRGNKSVKPLVDTGAMLASVSLEVEDV